MTTKELLAQRPARLTATEIIDATGVGSEARAVINVREAMLGNGELMMYNQFRVDDELVWTFWWRKKYEGHRLLAARTNLITERGGQ